MNKKILNEKKGWWVPFSNPKLNLKNTQRLFLESRVTLGKETYKLENIIKKKLKVNYVILTNSGTSALYMATLASQIHKKRGIFSPAINWPGSINGALYAGKKLKLIDSKKNFINGDYNSIIKNLKKDDLVYLTHLNGKCSYDKNFIKSWKDKKFFVIEDAAQAFMVKDYKNNFVGTQFNIGCFSLGITKICNMIYGGFCVTNNKNLAKELIKIRNNGVDNEFQKPTGIGGNFKPSDLHAVVGINSINSFKIIKKKLFQIYFLYKKNLKNNKIMMFDYDKEKREIPNYVEILSKNRNKLIIYLKKNKINFSYGTRLLNLSPRYSISGNLKNAKRFDKQLIRLPCGPGQSPNNIKKVIKILNNFT